MVSLRPPVLRHLLSSAPRTLRASHQRRWAQVHDVRFLATTQQPLNTIEKYREKLARKAQEEGHGTIDSLKAAYAEKIQKLRKEADVVVPTTPPPSPSSPQPSSQSTVQQPPPPQQQQQQKPNKSFDSSGIKPLGSILDLPKVSPLPEKELTAIWRFHHAAKPNSLCAVIPSGTYSQLESTARLNPHFVLPVPHPGQGAEIHFVQWTWDPATNSSTVLFTQLAEYKARGEFAQPHTTVTHYKDLAKDKGVVLMQGTVMEDRGVKVQDAQFLVMCLQRFYGGWDGVDGQAGMERAEERRRLLEWFGRGDARFSVDKLLEEAERMG
ncbi:ATP11 protein-domain-containing protein [Triangularia verruculosa]|uniref:ATP11 protein-domain-containing protein n=1 Tax=Triangularia verruculosa TaxID=2587418 RepID=A0AAN6XF60_9PEZI|nr:ATP11 protein-domain-containing protein [Triangularia verruculosa]